MDNTKARKAKEEVAWEEARVFVHLFESWLKGKPTKIKYKEKGEDVSFFSQLGKKEKEWLASSYKKAKKEEKKLFLKTLIYFMYGLGTKRIGCENLIMMLKKMAEDSARLGEFYDYLVQYGDERVDHRDFRFDEVVSLIKMESGIENDYYGWFYEEFMVPPEGVWSGYPSFFTTKSPRELIEMRANVNWKSLSNILSSIYGIYVGHAALGKLKDYVENGGIARLTFRDRKRAARIATLLFEFGLQDISQKSNRIVLGLKETVYDARQRVSAPPVPTGKYFMDSCLGYFREHGLETAKAEEITRLFDGGKEAEAVESMCRTVLQMCKREYLVMGQKKYTFGDEGKQMLSDFKESAGGEGQASLLSLYDMVTRREYAPAIARMRAILDAIDNVKGKYPHLFSA